MHGRTVFRPEASIERSDTLLPLVDGLIGNLAVDVEGATDVRANMKGGYFGKGGGNPYVKLCLGVGSAASARTRAAVGDSANPTWHSAENNRHTLPLPLKPEVCPVLSLEVWNENTFADEKLGVARVNLAPVLLNPGMVFRRSHVCWDPQDLHGGADSPDPAALAEAVAQCSLTVGLRFDPTQGVYSCHWEEHKFIRQDGVRSLVPRLCGVCGKPLLGPFPRWVSCSVCGKDVHERCLPLVPARLPCRPSIVTSSTLKTHDAKLEAQSIGTLYLHLDVAHICQPECTALYHVRVHKDDTSAIKSMSRQRSWSRGGADRQDAAVTARDKKHQGGGAQALFGSPVTDVAKLRPGRCVYCRIVFESKQVCSPTYMLGGGRDPHIDLQLAYFVRNSRSSLKVEVVDGVSNSVIGECIFSILDVVEQMSTVRFGGAPEEFGLESPGPSRSGLQWFALVGEGDGSKPDACSSAALERAKGFVTMRLYWHQEPLKCLDVDPPKITPPPFDVDELKDNVMRLQGIIAWIDFFVDGGGRIFSWEDPSFTFICLVVFLYLSIWFDWSRFLCLPTGFLFLALAWNYRNRLSGKFNRAWFESVGTPELSSLAVSVSVNELSFVPDDDDNDSGDESKGDDEPMTHAQKSLNRAKALLSGLCVEIYFIAKEKANSDGVEQLVGRCWPTIRVETEEEESENEDEPQSAGDVTESSWGLGSLAAGVTAGVSMLSGGGTEAPKLSPGKHMDIISEREDEAGPLAVIADITEAQEASSEQSSEQNGADGSVEPAPSASANNTKKMAFRFSLIQTLTSVAGREVPLPWEENAGVIAIRAKLPAATCDRSLTRGKTDKNDLCVVAEKELQLKRFVVGFDTKRHTKNQCVNFDVPEPDDELLESADAGTMELDLSALACIQTQVIEGKGKEKELQEALQKQTEAIAKAKKEQEEPSSLSILDTYRQVKMQAREVQNLIGDIVGQLESIKNILTWSYPPITYYLMYAAMAATIITYFIPTSFILFIGGVYMFADGWWQMYGYGGERESVKERRGKKKSKKKKVVDDEEPIPDWEKIVMQVPNDRDLRRAFTIRKEIVMANRERRRRLEELGAVWQGLLTVIEPSEAKSNRFVVIRKREFVWWKTLAAAEGGAAPKGKFSFKQILVVYTPKAKGGNGSAQDEWDGSDISACSIRVAGDPEGGKSVAAGAKPFEVDLVAQEGPAQRDEVLRALESAGGHRDDDVQLFAHDPPADIQSHAFLISHDVKLYFDAKPPKGANRMLRSIVNRVKNT
eukprot:g1401.t1